MNHVDVRHHFIQDYAEEETVKIKFVYSEENLADPFTKNLRDIQTLRVVYCIDLM